MRRAARQHPTAPASKIEVDVELALVELAFVEFESVLAVLWRPTTVVTALVPPLLGAFPCAVEGRQRTRW